MTPALHRDAGALVGVAALRALFAPRSVGIVGVSGSRPDSWGRRTLDVLLAGGYSGDVVAIGPQEPLPGVRTVPRLADLAEAPELLVVAVPAPAVPDVVEQARRRGAGAAIIYSSGFAEMGSAGRQLEERLRQAAGPMPFLGPNCLGVVNRSKRLLVSTTAFLDRPRPAPGPVAVLTQSGALGFVLADLLEQRGLGYSYYASMGNEGGLRTAQVGQYLVEQSDVEVLVLYLEGVRDPQGLLALGRRSRELGKRVVVLAAGSSGAGRRAALSHTAAVAGDDLLLSALCRQGGMDRVRDDEELADAIVGMQRGAALTARPRVAVVTMSGGAGAVLADRLSAVGADVPTLSATVRSKLAELGAGAVGDQNPIDLGGMFGRSIDRVAAVCQLLDDASDIDAIVLYFTFGDMLREAYASLADTATRMRTPAWLVWGAAPPGALAEVGRPDVVVPSIAAVVRQISSLVGRARPVAPSDAGGDELVAATPVELPEGLLLSEAEAGPVLSAVGIPYVPTVVASSAEEAAVAVDSAGWPGPYVVKGDAADVPHRAKHGLIRLGVAREDLVEQAQRMLNSTGLLSGAPRQQVIVQPMIAHDVEIGIGAVRDPVFGAALVVGRGGTAIEDFDSDRDAVLLPATAADVQALAKRVADRWPGLPEADLRSILQLLAGLLTSRPDVVEVDVNPVVVTAEGALLAVDCLIVRSEKGQEDV